MRIMFYNFAWSCVKHHLTPCKKFYLLLRNKCVIRNYRCQTAYLLLPLQLKFAILCISHNNLCILTYFKFVIGLAITHFLNSIYNRSKLLLLDLLKQLMDCTFFHRILSWKKHQLHQSAILKYLLILFPTKYFF
jgi:hypothetical protein